jgi:MYXO-CTERM domain-containing protein
MRFAIAVVVLGIATTAHAHLQLRNPPARTTAQKAGPCGAAGSKRGTIVTTYQPGETITIEWDETVDHPGHYRIAFDDDGDDIFINPLRSTDNFSFTVMDKIPDKVGGRYTQQITLPTTPCANCTLQIMQIMQVNEPYNSFYWQCADIVIAGMEPEPMPDDGGGCSTSGGAGGLLVALALLFVRRRR